MGLLHRVSLLFCLSWLYLWIMWAWSEGLRRRRRPTWPWKEQKRGRGDKDQPSPCPQLIAASGLELLQNVSAFSLELIDLNDCLKLTQCKAGWRKPNSEKWNVPFVLNLECWAELFLPYAALCHRYTQPTVIWVFLQVCNSSENKLLWFCPLHQKCLVCGSFVKLRLSDFIFRHQYLIVTWGFGLKHWFRLSTF